MKRTFKTNGRLLSQIFSSYNTTFDALCELINNSIQAKSNEIKIEIDFVEDADLNPFPFTEFRIIDNGEGVSRSDFARKILEIATDVKNSKGIGRFAAFQIGSTIIIDTTSYDNTSQKYINTKVPFDAKSFAMNDLGEYHIDIVSTEYESKPQNTFYKVTVRDFWDEIEVEKNPKRKLISKLIPGNLEEAIFLKYSSYIVTEKVSFFINSIKVSKNAFLIGDIENDDFDFVFSDGTTTKISLEFVNYKGKNKRTILTYRVDNNGIKTSAYEDSISIDYPGENSWVVSVDNDYFNSKADIFRNIFLDGLDEDVDKLKKQVVSTVREFFKSKFKDYSIFIDKLKSDSFYPYKGESSYSTKEFTFNQLAYYIEEDYSLLKNNLDTRKIIYPLLDKVMGNRDFVNILEKVISLDDEKARMFKELLEKTDLPDIIEFTTEVAHKQNFLDFLYSIIYGDIGKYIKERSQLQKIIEKNLWLFGEEYANSSAVFFDKNIENNLNELRDKYFIYQPTVEDENLVDVSTDKIADITDLFIYNDRPLPNKKHEILIVELKSPKVKISMKELDQTRKYRQDIEKLGKFSRENTKYKIILVSSNINQTARSEIGSLDKNQPTLYQKSKDYDIEVHVVIWSDIIDERKQYLKYLGNYLKTKDVDLQNIFKKDYPELDISKLPLPTKKAKK